MKLVPVVFFFLDYSYAGWGSLGAVMQKINFLKLCVVGCTNNKQQWAYFVVGTFFFLVCKVVSSFPLVTQGRSRSSVLFVAGPLLKSPMWRSTCRHIRCGHQELGVPYLGALSLCKLWHWTPTNKRRKMQVLYLLEGWPDFCMIVIPLGLSFIYIYSP